MNDRFSKNQIALAVAATIGATAIATIPNSANAAKTAGKYVAGDFHNHTTCSDGTLSMQKLVKKATDKTTESPWGLDWFVQAGHGGSGNRNCTLVEDDALATPLYPVRFAANGVTKQGPTTTWQNTNPPVQPKGTVSGSSPNQNMWRWQAIQEFQYPIIEYLNKLKDLPLFIGMESVVAGHEHSSMTVITGQIPAALDSATLPAAPGADPNRPYPALGNANALSQWAYCFDAGNGGDLGRGNATVGTTPVAGGNNWDCSVPGSPNSGDASWNTTGQKLVPIAPVGTNGHIKTVEGMKWAAQFHPSASYYVPAHLERAGPFNPTGNNGFNVEHLRNFNNAAPSVAFGFETQPGHHGSDNRGEYAVNRNNINGVQTDSVGGTTYGGTGVYGGQIGGVWDALLGEGRGFWFFASSDWHARGSFSAEDRRTTGDFFPGEYQRTYALVRNGSDKIRPQPVVDGLRSGNVWAATGQLIDRLAFIACASNPGPGARTNASVETLALSAASGNTDIDVAGCATMGEKLKVRGGQTVVVAIVARDPLGSNFSPYTFPNPSLLQVGINQPVNAPVLDHIDMIRGLVAGYRAPGSADYAGEWPRNLNWLRADGTTPATNVSDTATALAGVPTAAKNVTAAIYKTFSGNGAGWTQTTVEGVPYLKMSYRVPVGDLGSSQYLRLRGTNLPAAVPFETDNLGNPMADVYTNASNPARLAINCTTAHSTGNQFDGCPDHLPTVGGQKKVAFDVAAWSDLWFYSNPIFIEVAGSTTVAGVQ